MAIVIEHDDLLRLGYRCSICNRTFSTAFWCGWHYRACHVDNGSEQLPIDIAENPWDKPDENGVATSDHVAG